jgi:acetyl esterase/lipase
MKKIIVLAFIITSLQLHAQQFIPIWPEGKKPNFNGVVVKDSITNRVWKVGTPGFYAFIVQPEENSGTAVLICPGGGYERLAYLQSGYTLAKWYNTHGISAFVLNYRLPDQPDLINRKIAPLQDAQRAMKVIRKHIAEWNIQTDKIGVMGISAGGHLASWLGESEEDVSVIKDALDTVNYHPDFMVLLSPVISLGKYTHVGSRNNLLGADTTQGEIEKYSNELHVNPNVPPTFIVHAYNDPAVNVRNSLMFYSALVENNVNASLHIFPQGGHGIRLYDNPGSTELWTNLLELWLKEMNLFTPVAFK